MTRLEGIADPVRLAIARRLAEHPGASAPQVAAGAGVHLNTARAHLAALHRAGLVRRYSDAGGIGRPVVRYSLVEDWQPQGDELLGLSSLLASALLGMDADPARLHELARDWGRRWAREKGSRSVWEQLASALRRLGLRAERHGERLELTDCPCPLVAPQRPPLVCKLVDAVIDGVLEGSHLTAQSHTHDPRARRCSAVLSTTPA